MKVLFNPMGGSLAHTVRCIAVAEELRDRKHEVFFTAPRDQIAFIKDQGFEVVGDFEVVSFTDPEDQSLNYMESNKDKFVEWFKTEIAAVDMIKPDVVVTAPGFLGSTIWHARKIPNVAILDSVYTYKSKGILGLSLSDDSVKSVVLRRLIQPVFESKFYELYITQVLDIYNRLGISTENVKTRKDVQSFTKIIVPGDSQLEVLKDNLDQDIIHVGPIFWKGWEEMETRFTDDYILNFKKNNFLVGVFFGGSVHDRNIYENVINTFKDNAANMKVIIGFGPNYKRSDFPADNDKILFSKYLPGLRISRHADLIVNTGAQGGTSQALYYGKPVIAFPTNIDQSYYANRLEELKLGINVNKVKLSEFSKRESYANVDDTISDKIINAINKIRKDIKYKERAVCFSKFLQNTYHDPVHASADIIEDIVRNGL